MKHINKWKMFESEERQAQIPKFKNKYQGFCLTATWCYDRSDAATLMVASSCLTIQDFMGQILTEICGDYLDEAEVSDLKTIEELMDFIGEHYEVYCDWKLWCGLEPISQREEYESTGLGNPYVTGNILNSMFSNVPQIMGGSSGRKSPNDDENKAIAISIENNTELISVYANYAEFNKVRKFMSLPDREIDLILNYHQNLKGML
jgi:hypothetical protein